MTAFSAFSFSRVSTFAILLTAAMLLISSVSAAPRALPPAQLPNDSRLGPLKDLDGYFPFTPSKSPEDWSRRANHARRQILVSQGLWPMPTRTPLNPVVHGRIDRGDYTVEKVYFESIPGFFVTGNLYRPKDRTGRLPGVLCPHGHWNNGRFLDSGLANVQKQIVEGAEKFEEGGRSVLQSRCVQLARMGCVVFHYDMIGYADSTQISMEIAHGFKKQRSEMNTTENWGLFSPQAEAHLQSVMGLQTWNSIRALDFLTDLPDVDPERIACTGASGGGTQTFILGAIDPRVKVAFPAVMVGTAMQGGCTCENACALRIGTGNVEFAAMFAPKPLGMTAADDWTKEMPAKGFPELKQHYTMMHAPDNVSLTPLLQFPHNYNLPSRAAMYIWLNRHLKLGLSEPIVETDYRRLSREEMSVWDEQHPKPPGGPEFERKLLNWLTADAAKQLAEAKKSPAEYRQLTAGAINVLIGRNLSEVGDVVWNQKVKTDRNTWIEMAGLLRNTTHDEELPSVFLFPKDWKGRTVIWLDRAGKQGLFTDASSSEPTPEVRRLLDAGATVIGVDLLYQGEFLADGKPLTTTRRVENPRESAAYTLGYNHSLFAQRVHDILTVVKFVSAHERRSDRIDLVGLNGAGPWVAAALVQSGDVIQGAALDTGGFRFGNVGDVRDPNLLPGGAKYGDLPGMIALHGKGKVLVMGEKNAMSGADSTIAQSSGTAQARTVVEWLLPAVRN